jgi:hypothetical protein
VRQAEQGQHGQVRLAVAAVGSRVDETGRPVRSPEHVARPQVTVDEGGRLGRTRQSAEVGDDAFDVAGVVRGDGAGVGGGPQVRTDPALRPHFGPGRPRPGGQRERGDPAVAVDGAEDARAGTVGHRERPAETLGRLARRRSGMDPFEDEALAIVRDDGGHGHATGHGSQLA